MSILLSATTVHAQDRHDFAVRSDLSLPVLEPQLSSDGLTLYHGVPTLIFLADPNPAMQGLRTTGPTAAEELASPETATASFSLTFLGSGQQDLWGQSCGNFPEEAKTALQGAAAIWAHTVRSSVPITVTACWADLNSSNVLGYSGGGSLLRDFSNAPRSNTWYAKPLANSFAGTDFDTSSQDMHITYNSGFTFYYGTDGNPPVGLYDMATVGAHGIAHGLNLAGSAQYSGGTGAFGYLTGFPNVYDTYLKSGDGTPLTSYPNPSTALGNLLTSGELWFDGAHAEAGNGGTLVQMYAPSIWAGGSSYSNLDYSTFAGTQNSMMVYAIGSGSANHDIGTVTSGLLKDLGWGLASDTYSLGGIVKAGDFFGPALEGALVAIAGKTATTDSEGNFSIPGIRVGTYTLTISKPGYGTYNDAAFIVSFDQRSLFILPVSLCSIRGKVLSGSLTGAPLEGAQVSYAGSTVITDSTGAFSIPGICGSYDLGISKQGYEYAIYTHYDVYGEQAGLIFDLIPYRYTMSGTVLAGVSATGPTALAGATVEIAGQTATTDSSGAFSITGIPAGTYTLTISLEGYLKMTWSTYTIANDQIGVRFPLYRPFYTVSGTVHAGSATGPVLEGATVTIEGKTAITSSTGYFSVTVPRPGVYYLTVSRQGYLTTSSVHYYVNGDQSGVVFILFPIPNYHMNGTVLRKSIRGPALAGATISIAGKTALTDRTGAFNLETIPAGTYTLTISRTGYVTSIITSYVINRDQDGLVFPLTHVKDQDSGNDDEQ